MVTENDCRADFDECLQLDFVHSTNGTNVLYDVE